MDFPPTTSQQTQPMEWGQQQKNFQDQMTTQLLKRIYCDKPGKFDDPKIRETLEKYSEDTLQVDSNSFCAAGWSIFNAKFLHSSGVKFGPEETAQLFARFIHSAMDEKQLTNFLSFSLTVVPHLAQLQSANGPGVMTMAFLYAVLDSRKIEKEYRDNLDAIAKTDFTSQSARISMHPLERNLLRNLLMIVKWQEQSEQGASLKHIGLNLADIRGRLHEGLLSYALDYTDLVRNVNGGMLEQFSFWISTNVLSTFFTLMIIIVPQVQLPLRYQNNLLTKISSLFVSMLKLITNENLGTILDGVDLFALCCTLSGKIFIKQIGVHQTQLLRALMDEVFADYVQLFGANTNIGSNLLVKHNSREVGARLDYGKFWKIDFLNADKKTEHQIFTELRQMSFEKKSAASMAHSGKLMRKRMANEALAPPSAGDGVQATEPCQIRRLLFVDFVDQLCLNKQATQSSGTKSTELYNSNVCQYLGKLLIDRFTGDGLTSHLCWFPWVQERELIAQYIEVTKLMDRHPIVFDFLLLLSDSGFSGLCFAIPLLKALFVTTLGTLENTSLKTELISTTNQQRCTQILALLISADFFPKIMQIFQKLLCKCNNHESFVLMRDLWAFLHSVIPSPGEIDQNKIRINQSALQKKDGSRLISSMVLLIQRNITSMGSLLSQLLPLIDEKDEGDWSIESDSKPISVTAEIKR